MNEHYSYQSLTIFCSVFYFNILTKHFKPFQFSNVAVSASAKIGAGTVIQPNSFIGNHVVIGKKAIPLSAELKKALILHIQKI